MTSFKKGILLVLTGGFLVLATTAIVYPQGAVTLVQIVFGGAPVSSGNPLPITCTSGCSAGGGAVTIANGADVAEGSTTDAPATVPTSASAATSIALLKALNNALNASLPLPTGAATAANQTNGNQQVQGNVASGVADSGNPVKVGSKYNAVAASFNDGQRADLQSSTSGHIFSHLTGYNAVGSDGFTNSIAFAGLDNAGSNMAAATSTRLTLGVSAFLYNGSTRSQQRDILGAAPAGTGTTAVAIAPTSAAAGGITPVVTASAANNLVLKNTAGNMYSVTAVNLTATAGFLVMLNATASPADGAITPLECVPLPMSGSATINYNPGPPSVFSTGIVAVLTSASTCFTKTTGTITGFIKGMVQ